jgi:hypothetical protein
MPSVPPTLVPTPPAQLGKVTLLIPSMYSTSIPNCCLNGRRTSATPLATPNLTVTRHGTPGIEVLEHMLVRTPLTSATPLATPNLTVTRHGTPGIEVLEHMLVRTPLTTHLITATPATPDPCEVFDAQQIFMNVTLSMPYLWILVRLSFGSTEACAMLKASTVT